MRLIDADKLLFSLEEWEINETPNATTTYPKPKEFTAYDMQRMIWRTIIDCESAVEEQPTVKAIPIERIKKKLKCCDNINAEIFVKSLIREWEKENGRS